MAGPKRTEFQREYDYTRISELYLKGWYQADIARQLDVTQQQVSHDLKTIRKRWRNDTAINLDEAKSRELARIDTLEKEYWDAWQASKGEREKARQESSGKDAQGKPIVTKTVAEKEKLIGNPAFLNGVQWCITERCKLLGIYAPERKSLEGKGGGDIKITVVYQDEL